jgi:acetolactate synthase-1/2/3 large subunit
MTSDLFEDAELLEQIKSKQPMIIEVPIDPEQTFFPKITSAIQPDGTMKSNPLHLMSPELPEEISKKVLKYLKA